MVFSLHYDVIENISTIIYYTRPQKLLNKSWAIINSKLLEISKTQSNGFKCIFNPLNPSENPCFKAFHLRVGKAQV